MVNVYKIYINTCLIYSSDGKSEYTQKQPKNKLIIQMQKNPVIYFYQIFLLLI